MSLQDKKILKNPLLRGVSRSDGVCRKVVDFFCPGLKLVIVIDGAPTIVKKDRERQREIERLEIQFLRFNDLDTKENMTDVLSVIDQWVEKHTPNPSQEGN